MRNLTVMSCFHKCDGWMLTEIINVRKSTFSRVCVLGGEGGDAIVILSFPTNYLFTNRQQEGRRHAGGVDSGKEIEGWPIKTAVTGCERCSSCYAQPVK